MNRTRSKGGKNSTKKRLPEDMATLNAPPAKKYKVSV